MKLIKVGASWCAPCRQMDIELENFDMCPIIKYDADDDDDETLNFIETYKIKSVPTMFLMDDNNNILKSWIGTTSKSNIEEEIKKYL